MNKKDKGNGKKAGAKDKSKKVCSYKVLKKHCLNVRRNDTLEPPCISVYLGLTLNNYAIHLSIVKLYPLFIYIHMYVF